MLRTSFLASFFAKKSKNRLTKDLIYDILVS